MGRRNFVGIQIGLISLIDEGTATVLDILQERARVNALLPSTVSWSRGNTGRALDWYPDHGKAEPDHLQGGAFFKPNPVYYQNTTLKEFMAPDPTLQGYDFFEMLMPEAQKRKMKVIPYYCETSRPDPRAVNIPGLVHVLEVDIWGRRTGRFCVNNPDYRAWVLAQIEDQMKSYPVDGYCWGVERKGPLFLTLDGEVPTCFCNHCQQAARNRGIDVERARAGYQAVYEYAQAARRGKELPDGHLVEFLRRLLHHPEVLMWEKAWHESHKSLFREIYGAVKWIRPEAEVGIHIWQFLNTYDPFLRAQFDLSEFKLCADWVKPVMYNEVSGARFHKIVDNFRQTYMGDFSSQEATQVLYKVLQLDEPPYERLVEDGFSPRYVFNETARTVRAVAPDVSVYPGLGVGVQGVPANACQITPTSVRAAIRAAYEGGAGGIVISRNYSEARLENLSAVGAALDELGIGELIPRGLAKVAEAEAVGSAASNVRGQDRGF